MHTRSKLVFAATLALLAACGHTPRDQAVLGAAAGTAGAVLTHGDPVTGALAGATANLLYCQTYPKRC